MHVASICFMSFQMFHTYIASVCICLQRLSSVFRRFSKGFIRLFQVFHVSCFYVLIGCFKNRSGVAHKMCMENNWRRRRRLGRRDRRPRRCGPTAGALVRKPVRTLARLLCGLHSNASASDQTSGSTESLLNSPSAELGIFRNLLVAHFSFN